MGLKGIVLGPVVFALFLALVNLTRDIEDEMAPNERLR